MDQATDLRALVRKVAPAPAPTAVRPRRIVVFGGKGGVGTTTIALNLAVALAQQGGRTLLCDAAGGDVALQTRLEPRHTLGDVLQGNISVPRVLASGPAGVQILPSARDADRRPESTDHAWTRLMAQLSAVLPRPDVLVIDAGNRPDALARQLWQLADRVLLVATAETTAIMNAYAAIKLLNDPARSASIALLVNRSPDAATADQVQRRLVHACRRFLGLSLRSVGAAPEDAAVSRCTAQGEPFVLAEPACAAALHLRQAARAVANHEVRKRVAA